MAMVTLGWTRKTGVWGAHFPETTVFVGALLACLAIFSPLTSQAGCPSRPAASGLGDYAAPDPRPVTPSGGGQDTPFNALSSGAEGGTPIGLVSPRKGTIAFGWHLGGAVSLLYASDYPSGFSLSAGGWEDLRVALAGDQKSAELESSSGHAVPYAWVLPPDGQLPGYVGRTFKRVTEYSDGYGLMGFGASEMVLKTLYGQTCTLSRFKDLEKGAGKAFLLTRIEGPGQRLLVIERDPGGRVTSAVANGETLVTASTACQDGITTLSYTRGGFPLADLSYDAAGALVSMRLYKAYWVNRDGEAAFSPNIADFTLSYDQTGRLVMISGGAAPALLGLTYDADERISEVRTPTTVRTYTYSDLPGGLHVNVDFSSGGEGLGDVSIPSAEQVQYADGDCELPDAICPEEGIHCEMVTDCAEKTRTKYWNINEKLIAYKDKENHMTYYCYDNTTLHNLIEMDTPRGLHWYWEYDANGNVTHETNPAGTHSYWLYDGGGNVTRHTESYTPGGPGLTDISRYETWTYPQTLAGLVARPATHTDYGGHTSQFNRYIETGYLVEDTETDPMGFVTVTTYIPDDIDPYQINVTRPNGTVWQYYYCIIGSEKQLQAVVIPGEGQQIDINPLFQAWYGLCQHEYAQRDNRCTTHFPNPSSCSSLVEATHYNYDDGTALLYYQRDPMSYNARYEYINCNDKFRMTVRKRWTNPYTGHTGDCPLWTPTNTQGVVDTYSYSCRGDMLSETAADGAVTTYTYDGNHNVLTKRDPFTRLTTYIYDEENNLTKIDYANGRQEQYLYDSMNRLQQATGLDSQSQYTYDGFGRITQVINTIGGATTTETYTYDYDDNRLSFSGVNGTVHYAYDANHRVTQITDPQGDITSFSYYSCCGNLDTVTFPARYNLKTVYSWDSREQLTGVATKKASDNSVVRSVAYGLDSNGLRTSKTRESSALNEYYTYNDRLELTGVKPSPASLSGASFAYDSRGNRLTATWRNNFGTIYRQENFTYDDANKILTWEEPLVTPGAISHTFAYPIPDEGYSAQIDETIATAGQLGGELKQSYYDHRGKLALFTHSKTRLNPPQPPSSWWSAVENRYMPDGLGRLGQQDHIWSGNIQVETNGMRVKRYYQDFLDTYRMDEDYSMTTTVGGEPIYIHENTRRDYTLAPGIDNWLAMKNTNLLNSTSSNYAFAKDGLNSTMALIGDGGTAPVAEAYEYDAWGNMTSGEPQLNPFTYTGREWDADLGQYNYRSRIYNPRLGRFERQDMFGTKDRVYALNSPNNLRDPYGGTPYGGYFDACQYKQTWRECANCCDSVESKALQEEGVSLFKKLALGCGVGAIGGAGWSAASIIGAIAIVPGMAIGCMIGMVQAETWFTSFLAELGGESLHCEVLCAKKED